jgi:hypothetical protein
MKIKKLIAMCSVTLLAVLSAHAQTFQNLNFEEADPINAGNPYYPEFVTTASALPYWTVYYGTDQQTEITYNDPSLGSEWVMLVGPGDVYGPPLLMETIVSICRAVTFRRRLPSAKPA